MQHIQLPISLDYIRQVVAEYFTDRPVKRVQVFGSSVCDEATAESDLNLLLEMKHHVGGSYFSYADDPSQRLNLKVGFGTTVLDHLMRCAKKIIHLL